MDIKEKNTKSASDIMLIVYYDDYSYSKSFFLEKSDLDCSSLAWMELINDDVKLKSVNKIPIGFEQYFRGKRKGSYGFIPKIPNFLQKT